MGTDFDRHRRLLLRIPPDIVADGLVSWWDFRGGYFTTTLIDRVGGHDGVITNAAVGVFWENGKGQGVFDGIETVSMGDNSAFDIVAAGSTTVSIWFFHADSSRAGLVGKSDAGIVGDTGWWITHEPTGEIHLVYGDSVGDGSTMSDGTLDSSVWNVVDVVIDKDLDTVDVYFNGELDTSDTVTQSGDWTKARPFVIGAIEGPTSPTLPLNGNIGSVKFYNIGLTSAQVKQNFEAERRIYGI